MADVGAGAASASPSAGATDNGLHHIGRGVVVRLPLGVGLPGWCRIDGGDVDVEASVLVATWLHIVWMLVNSCALNVVVSPSPPKSSDKQRIFMQERGVEPLHLSVQDPKSCASANSATPACRLIRELVGEHVKFRSGN
jgi:hypothetical protein